MSVKQAQREIDSREFTEWMAYWNVEPFGPEREDQRAGEIAAVIANVNRDPKTKSEPWTAVDFFPRLAVVRSAETERPTEEEEEERPAGPTLEDKIRGWAARMGAQKAKGRRG
jgi:hypothetical protein